MLSKKLDPQQLSVAVNRFGSTDTKPQVFDGSKVQWRSKALISSGEDLKRIIPREPPNTSTDPPTVCKAMYSGRFILY